MKPVSCNQRNGGHRKAFVLRSPTGSSSVSGSVEKNVFVNCLHAALTSKGIVVSVTQSLL